MRSIDEQIAEHEYWGRWQEVERLKNQKNKKCEVKTNEENN